MSVGVRPPLPPSPLSPTDPNVCGAQGVNDLIVTAYAPPRIPLRTPSARLTIGTLGCSHTGSGNVRRPSRLSPNICAYIDDVMRHQSVATVPRSVSPSYAPRLPHLLLPLLLTSHLSSSSSPSEASVRPPCPLLPFSSATDDVRLKRYSPEISVRFFLFPHKIENVRTDAIVSPAITILASARPSSPLLYAPQLNPFVLVLIFRLRPPGTYIGFADTYSVSSLLLSTPSNRHSAGSKKKWLWYATFGARAGIDVVIATSIYLMMRKYRGGFQRCVLPLLSLS